MISVDEAKRLVLKNCSPLKPSIEKLFTINRRVLFEKIKAPINLPPFDQSAMDGFAILFSDLENKKQIKIIGEVPAGKPYQSTLKSGTALRIFTGAAIPKGSDTVVMQEKVKINDKLLFVEDSQLKKGANIREAGSQIKKGSTAFEKGSMLNPGALGFLSAMGIEKVKVYAAPKISIIVTGDEIKKPGTALKSGQIYESNSFALLSALQSIGINNARVLFVPDNFKKTVTALTKALASSDMVLLTGGISVGKYDFVGEALEKNRVKNIFYKIKQKPGKPLFFGKKNNTLIFALPGNPAAVLTCFYEYVYPALNCLKKSDEIFMRIDRLKLDADYQKKQGLSFFLKGKMNGEKVHLHEGQESYIMSSFAEADCLVYLPENMENPKKGELVEVHILPGLY